MAYSALSIAPYPITLEGQTVTLVDLPDTPGFRMLEWMSTDTVGKVKYPFSGKTQTQKWPGADTLSGTVTLPNLTEAQAGEWKAALRACRGIANGFMLGDPMRPGPTVGIPGLVAAVGYTALPAGSEILYLHTVANSGEFLATGDCIQVGYRLHYVLTNLQTNAEGDTTAFIWPTLRAPVAVGDPVILVGAQGIFRRSSNSFTTSTTVGGITTLSFGIEEYR